MKSSIWQVADNWNRFLFKDQWAPTLKPWRAYDQLTCCLRIECENTGRWVARSEYNKAKAQVPNTSRILQSRSTLRLIHDYIYGWWVNSAVEGQCGSRQVFSCQAHLISLRKANWCALSFVCWVRRSSARNALHLLPLWPSHPCLDSSVLLSSGNHLHLQFRGTYQHSAATAFLSEQF